MIRFLEWLKWKGECRKLKLAAIAAFEVAGWCRHYEMTNAADEAETTAKNFIRRLVELESK